MILKPVSAGRDDDDDDACTAFRLSGRRGCCTQRLGCGVVQMIMASRTKGKNQDASGRKTRREGGRKGGKEEERKEKSKKVRKGGRVEEKEGKRGTVGRKGGSWRVRRGGDEGGRRKEREKCGWDCMLYLYRLSRLN